MSRRSNLCRAAVVLAAVAATLAAAAPAHAAAPTQRLAHKPTGLTVAAPKGYSVTESAGYYTVRGKGSFGVFTRGASPLSLAATAKALVKASKGKAIGSATSTKTTYRVTLKVGKRLYVLRLQAKAGGLMDVSLVGPGAAPMLKDGRLVRLSLTQLAQIAVLDRIIASRRGGATAPINVQVPMRLAQTPDLLASANVPATPGWVVDGNNGLITVTHPDLGFGWFGMTIAALTPSFPFGRPGIDVIVTPTNNPGQDMVNVLPQFMALKVNMPFQFTQVQLVPGTENILGPTIPSAIYQIRGTWRGKSVQGLFLWGTLNNVEGLLNSYFSGVLIADNAPGGYSNALLQSWASANGEAGFRERLSTSLENLADRPNREFILTPSRFRSDASTWISLLASGER